MKKWLMGIFVVVFLSLGILIQNKSMLMLGLMALGFGLRHGLDADHVIAIDNVTRKFQAENKNSYLTGLFFALGHSSIVFLLTLAIICGVSHVHHHFELLKNWGSVIGSFISAVFLWLTAGMNMHALYQNKKNQSHSYPQGVMFVVIKRFFYYINKPYKMFFVGFLFGLGFDTATEVGLLSISATSVLQGIKISFILLLPILFACGMVFTDLLDSIFMSSLYRMTSCKQNQLQFYYRAIISVTTLLALIVGLVEFIGILNANVVNVYVLKLSDVINDHFETIGEWIVTIFLATFCYLKYRRIQVSSIDPLRRDFRNRT